MDCEGACQTNGVRLVPAPDNDDSVVDEISDHEHEDDHSEVDVLQEHEHNDNTVVDEIQDHVYVDVYDVFAVVDFR